MFKNRFIMVSKKNLWRNVGNIKNIFVPLQRIFNQNPPNHNDK